MSRDLTGKTAFVTGAAHGIGAATARRLAADGARVVLADIDTHAARQVAAELEQEWVVECDMTSTESVDAAIATAVELAGGLDLLVSVAGASTDDQDVANDAKDAAWEFMLNLNLSGPMRLIRAGCAHLGAGGAIVLVSSVNGLQAFGEDGYSTAKAGLVNLAKNLAVDLGPRGIRINVVAPGTVRTRVWEAWGDPEDLTPLYPLGRIGEPEDIAAAIAFLLSDDAAWITGITLPVDGGVTAGPKRHFRNLRNQRDADRAG